MKNKRYIVALTVLVLLIAGFFIPLDSYTTKYGCTDGPTATERLDVILGDSIQEIKNGDVEPAPYEGCPIKTKFVLYLL